MEIRLYCIFCQYVLKVWRAVTLFHITVEPFEDRITDVKCPHCGNQQWVLRVEIKAGTYEPRVEMDI